MHTCTQNTHTLHHTVVAGNALIARQYFMAGFYPSGVRTAGNAYTPSGVLLKAVLIGGASDMIGYTEVRGCMQQSSCQRLCSCCCCLRAGSCSLLWVNFQSLGLH